MSLREHIERKLGAAFATSHLEVVNESGRHNVPPDSEMHFKVTLVSDDFRGKPMVARHRMIYACLSEEMAGPIHALALHTYTVTEWQRPAGDASPASPPCRGGLAGK